MDINKPLTEQELIELDEFLLSDSVPENCMSLEELDGFLTGIVIGPKTIMPSVWLDEIFGGKEDDEMIWDSDEQAQKFHELILRHYQSIVDTFHSHERYFEPIFTEFKELTNIDDWVVGFNRAIELDKMSWAPLINHKDGMLYLLPILLFGTPEGRKELDNNPELKELSQDDWVQSLVNKVLEIYEFWLPYRRGEVQTIESSVPKIGRNDPCPCGSGKKFKKCCLHKIPNA